MAKCPRVKMMKVAFKLFNEGNETVKNGIMNVYINTLSDTLDKEKANRKWIEPLMPRELRIEYARWHQESVI